MSHMEDFATTTVDKVTGQVPDISRDILIENVKKSMTSPNHEIKIGKVDIKFGVATYNRWQHTVVDVPEVRMVKKERRVLGRRIVWHEPEIVLVRHENNIPLPNWHQPYVAVRVQ
jgi:hypothetical protein